MERNKTIILRDLGDDNFAVDTYLMGTDTALRTCRSDHHLAGSEKKLWAYKIGRNELGQPAFFQVAVLEPEKEE